MYNETMYLNYYDLNNVEDLIDYVIDRLKVVSEEYLISNSHLWLPNDFPYIQEIDRIEKLIDNCGKNYYLPEGWQECKVWLTGDETEQVIKTFSYEDINRWIINLQLLKAIVDTFTFSTFSGSDIIINNLPVNSRFRWFKLYGNTYQQTYSGKNLFNYNNYIKGYFERNQNITNGVIERNCIFYIKCEANTTYTFKSQIENIQQILIANTSTTPAYGVSTSNSYQINKQTLRTTGFQYTTSSTAQYIVIRVQIASGYSFNYTTPNFTDFIYETQLEKGNQATSFEPYVGGTPSPNPDYPQEVQTVTGRQVVDINGKNLFDIEDINTITTNYVSIDENGWITVTINNTSSSTMYANIYTNKSNSLKPDTNYKVIAEIKQKTGSFRDLTLTSNANNTQANTINNVRLSEVPSSGVITRDFVTKSDFTNCTLMLRSYVAFATGHSGSITFRLSVVEDTSITPETFIYEPYQEPQQYEINLGKNLFDINGELYSGSITKYNNGFTLIKGTNRTLALILTTPLQAGTYTISSDIITNTMSDINKLILNFRTDSLSLIYVNLDSNGKATFTLTNTATRLYAYINNDQDNSATITLDNVQIESGSTTTTYSQYFTPIELNKIGEYQDYIDGDVDNWYVNSYVGKVVLDGSESGWSYNDVNQVFIVPDLVNYLRSGFVPYSNYYQGQSVTLYNQVETNHIAFLQSTTQNRLLIKNLNYTGVDAFKTWLSTHNTKVVYVLAEPTRTKITNTELVEQLNNLAENKMLSGYKNIIISGNLPGILNAEYLSNTGDNTTIWNIQSNINWNEESDIEWSDV